VAPAPEHCDYRDGPVWDGGLRGVQRRSHPGGPAASEYVAVVNITGEIGGEEHATGEAVVAALKRAFEDKKASRVILRIDSGGGRPHDAEEITRALDHLKVKHKKPVDAVIETVGASAAYMIAVHADRVYLGRYSIAGSVGALMSSWNWSRIVDRFQVRHDTYVSGQLKDMLNPYRATRPEESAKVQGMVDTLANVFADEVIQSRQGKIKLSKPALMTGEVWIGQEAIKYGLADALGTLDTVADSHDLKLFSVGPHPDQGIRIPLLSSLADDFVDSVANRVTRILGQTDPYAVR
jgi:protease-4